MRVKEIIKRHGVSKSQNVILECEHCAYEIECFIYSDETTMKRLSSEKCPQCGRTSKSRRPLNPINKK